jgi:photosystem II stability/assembly factor-like uncharacterized protein
MKHSFVLIPILLILFLQLPAQDRPSSGKERVQAFKKQKNSLARSPFQNLIWRLTGPDIISGRCTEVLGISGNKNVIWASFATSGFWKTEDAGRTWASLFDKEGTQSIGAFAVAPSNQQIIYVGTGESNIFRASLPGMGVYKSRDGGKTWAHAGLAGSGTISRVIIHPEDPNIVYVAASGNEWSHSKDRGLYVTRNGGRSWKRLIPEDPNGIIDLVMHPTDPRIMYASSWNRIRLRWSDPTPAENDFIWKTTDGGTTWNKLTNGLPNTTYTGRVGIALSQSDPNVLYALVDNHTPLRKPKENELDAYGRPIQIVPTGVQVWKSTDAGDHFAHASANEKKLEGFAGTYGWVFGQIRVDPTNENHVYILGVPLARSIDGGRTFNIMRADKTSERTHSDHHALWIDPKDPSYLINGNDGGVVTSSDSGRNWNNFFDVIPAAQFYNVTYDMKSPYNVMGSVQDHFSHMGSVKNTYGVKDSTILNWSNSPGGEGSIHEVDPLDPDLIYSSTFYGRLQRSKLFPAYQDSIEEKSIFPKKANDEEQHRGEWLAYTLLSPHDNKTIYHGFQYLFKSTDQGNTWKRISGDMSYNNKDRMGKTPYAINHQAITAIAESPLQKGLLYTGTDDGRVWISMNDGGEWKEIAQGLPAHVHVSRIIASKYNTGTVYITLSDRREDNIKPYIYRSNDYGNTWTAIVTDLPAAPVNVIREDPKDPKLLFCGTDMGVYVSRDHGRSWQSLQGNLPVSVSVSDLFVHPRDLNVVISTYGRGVWVLDDISALR